MLYLSTMLELKTTTKVCLFHETNKLMLNKLQKNTTGVDCSFVWPLTWDQFALGEAINDLLPSTTQLPRSQWNTNPSPTIRW